MIEEFPSAGMESGREAALIDGESHKDTWLLAKDERNWLVYRLVHRSGKKPQKIPRTPDGKSVGAKVAAVLNFDEAREISENLGADFGVGYLPREGSAMVCIDFDGVLQDGEVVQADLPELKSYTEVSPSGTGLHVLVARPNDKAPLTFDDGNDWVGYIGSDSKFFTVSLDRWGDQIEILSDDNLVKWVFERHQAVIDDANKTLAIRKQDWEKLKRRQLEDRNRHWFYHLPIKLRAKCASEILAVLPPEFAKGYDTWLKAGMALKLADEEYRLFKVWDHWSQTAPNYDGLTMEKWNQLAPTLDGQKAMVTIATLIYWAREHGWDPEPWNRRAQDIRFSGAADALEALRNTAPDPAAKTAVDAAPVTEPGKPPKVKDDLTRPGGLVEALTDFGERRSNRLTRLPALGGALAAVSALTQRKYIVVTPGFHTSPGLQVVVIGETGTGKEITRDIDSEVCRLCDGIGLAEAYASAPAMHRALNDKASQLWANDEFGRFLKAASQNNSGATDYGIVTMCMKLHTMFTKYLPERIYSNESSKPAVMHPLLVTAHTTTPKALYDSMTSATVVDGMLGRMLVIKQDGKPMLKPLGEVHAAALPSDIKTAIKGLETKILHQKLYHYDGAETVDGIGGHKFIAIKATKAAETHLEAIRLDCDARAIGDVASALWSRAYEQVLRVAGVVAFGYAVNDGCPLNPKITESILFWARDFVYHCLVELVPEAEEHASDGDRDKLQKSILRALRKLEADAGSDRWVKKQELLQRVKGRGRRYRDVKDEITALVDCGDIEFEKGEDGAPSRPERARTRD